MILVRKFADLTMVPGETFLDNLEVIRDKLKTDGAVVECGVWRGGMSGGMASLLGNGRTYYLVDSFEGLPVPSDKDGESAFQWQVDKDSPGYHDNCRAEEAFAQTAMQRAGCVNWHLVRGWFADTVPNLKVADGIALLRLDGDWYDSTMVCLDHLFDQVVSGGVIIIDDYYAWDGCTRAVHDFLSKRSATERIRAHGTVAYIVREGANCEVVPENGAM